MVENMNFCHAPMSRDSIWTEEEPVSLSEKVKIIQKKYKKDNFTFIFILTGSSTVH